MGTWVKARLIAMKTKSGLFDMHKTVARIGTEYLIDVESCRTVELRNKTSLLRCSAEIVTVIDPDDRCSWLPTELLTWEGKHGPN